VVILGFGQVTVFIVPKDILPVLLKKERNATKTSANDLEAYKVTSVAQALSFIL
jgi:hypothetical protein